MHMKICATKLEGWDESQGTQGCGGEKGSFDAQSWKRAGPARPTCTSKLQFVSIQVATPMPITSSLRKTRQHANLSPAESIETKPR
jgi:hypothetical protein